MQNAIKIYWKRIYFSKLRISYFFSSCVFLFHPLDQSSAVQKRGSLFPLKQSILEIIIKIKTILKLFIAQNKASDNLLSWSYIENLYL